MLVIPVLAGVFSITFDPRNLPKLYGDAFLLEFLDAGEEALPQIDVRDTLSVELAPSILAPLPHQLGDPIDYVLHIDGDDYGTPAFLIPWARLDGQDRSIELGTRARSANVAFGPKDRVERQSRLFLDRNIHEGRVVIELLWGKKRGLTRNDAFPDSILFAVAIARRVRIDQTFADFVCPLLADKTASTHVRSLGDFVLRCGIEEVNWRDGGVRQVDEFSERIRSCHGGGCDKTEGFREVARKEHLYRFLAQPSAIRRSL